MATVSELIAERRKRLSEGWQSFLNYPLHRSLAQIIDRKNTNLPSNYVPWAPAIALASNSLLKAAAASSQAGYPGKWRKHQRYGHYYRGEVRITERSGFWFIERGDQVLVFIFGTMPICTRTHRDAIGLFKHVFPQFASRQPPLGPRGHNLRWVRKTPDGILDC